MPRGFLAVRKDTPGLHRIRELIPDDDLIVALWVERDDVGTNVLDTFPDAIDYRIPELPASGQTEQRAGYFSQSLSPPSYFGFWSMSRQWYLLRCLNNRNITLAISSSA